MKIIEVVLAVCLLMFLVFLICTQGSELKAEKELLSCKEDLRTISEELYGMQYDACEQQFYILQVDPNEVQKVH